MKISLLVFHGPFFDSVHCRTWRVMNWVTLKIILGELSIVIQCAVKNSRYATKLETAVLDYRTTFNK